MKHAAVFQEVQMRIQGPTNAGAGNAPAGGIGVDLILRRTAARSDESSSIPQRQERWIPAAVLHRVNERPLLADRVEQQCSLEPDEWVVALSAARDQNAAVRQNGLPRAEHVDRCRRHAEAAVFVVVYGTAKAGGVQLVVARTCKEQDLPRMHERGMHSEKRRLAWQKFPVPLVRCFDRIDQRLCRYLEFLHSGFMCSTHFAVRVLSHHDDRFRNHTERRSHLLGLRKYMRSRRKDRRRCVVGCDVSVLMLVLGVVTVRRWLLAGGRRLMAMCREAPLKIDPTALIATAIHRQQQFRLLERSVGHPDALLNAYQAREARHHVLFDVAVKQKVRAYLNQARITGRTALQFLQLAGQANRWRHFGIENESLHRTQRMHIARTAWRCRYLPARRMWMEVVPHRSYVEIEQVPANLLARPADDRRGVADERSAVQAEREIAAAPREHDVLIAAEISPFDRGAGCDRDIGRHELVVFDANVDRRRIRRAAHDTNAARHAAAVNAADVVADLVGIGEVELKRP